MTTPRKRIIDFIEEGSLPVDNIQKALCLTDVYPSGKAWTHFLDSLCLWLGGLAFGVSVIFFVAYNWAGIGRFTKFGLIEILIVCGIISYCKFSDHKLIGKISLLVSTLFLGALMALYGQTYQTGADPWQLFFNWALLMLPWALIGCFSVLWIVCIILINLSIVLYHQTFGGALGVFFHSGESLLWIVFLFNTVALFCWEFLSRYWVWLQERWAIRLIAVGSGVSMTWLCIYAIFDDNASPMAGIVWIGWLIVLHYIYRRVKPDLFMLAGGCMSGIVVIVTFLSKYILENLDTGGFLLLAMLILALGTGAAVCLRDVNKELRP